MKAFSIVLALATMAGLTIAVPTPEENLEKRQTVGVLITADANWGGRREHLIVTRNVCHTLGNGWPNIISSFGPDPGLNCFIWDNNGCTGPSYGPITTPGVDNLANIGWNDRINSYRCS